MDLVGLRLSGTKQTFALDFLNASFLFVDKALAQNLCYKKFWSLFV
jgi:hypothetical protein